MATNQPTPQPQSAAEANAALIHSVSRPSCFRKLANVVGLVPRNGDEAEQTLRLADMIKQAVDKFIARRETAMQEGVAEAVKAAAEAAFQVAGVPTKQTEQAAAGNEEFLADEAVKAAAAFLVDEQVRKAASSIQLQTPAEADSAQPAAAAEPQQPAAA